MAHAGFDVIHTLDLPNQNRTADNDIIELADLQQRVLITKDTDFVDSHTLRGQPSKLLLISTGNISNNDLEAIMMPLLHVLEVEFRANSFLEMARSGIIVRG